MDFDVHQDNHTVKYILYTEYLGGVLSYLQLKHMGNSTLKFQQNSCFFNFERAL